MASRRLCRSLGPSTLNDVLKEALSENKGRGKNNRGKDD